MKHAMNRYVVFFVGFTLAVTIAASVISYLYSSSQFKITTEQQLLEYAIPQGVSSMKFIYDLILRLLRVQQGFSMQIPIMIMSWRHKNPRIFLFMILVTVNTSAGFTSPWVIKKVTG